MRKARRGNCLLFQAYSYRCPRADGSIRRGVLKFSETESVASGLECGGWVAVSAGVQTRGPKLSQAINEGSVRIKPTIRAELGDCA